MTDLKPPSGFTLDRPDTAEPPSGFQLDRPTQAAPAPPKSSAVRRVLGDTAIDAGKGVIGVGEAAVGLLDIPSLGGVGNALEGIGYHPQDAKDFLGEFYSPERQQANQQVADAKGFVGTAGAMLRNPSTIIGSAVESAPSMLGGAAIGRKALGALARPVLAASVGEGAVGAGQAAEQTRQQTGTLNPTQAGAAVASGVGTGLLSAVGGKIATKLGIADIDTALVGGATVEKPAGNIAKRLAEGVISEGVLEEAPQSAQEQAWQNYATGRPLGEGVAESTAQGALTGGLMGGGAAAIARPNVKPAGPIERAAQAAAPVVPHPGAQPGTMAAAANAVAGSAPVAIEPSAPTLTDAIQREKARKKGKNAPEAQAQPLTPQPEADVAQRVADMALRADALQPTPEMQANADAAELALAPPAGMDPATGEIPAPEPTIAAHLAEQGRTAGGVPGVSQIVRSFNVHPDKARALRKEALSLLEAQSTPPTLSLPEQGDGRQSAVGDGGSAVDLRGDAVASEGGADQPGPEVAGLPDHAQAAAADDTGHRDDPSRPDGAVPGAAAVDKAQERGVARAPSDLTFDGQQSQSLDELRAELDGVSEPRPAGEAGQASPQAAEAPQGSRTEATRAAQPDRGAAAPTMPASGSREAASPTPSVPQEVSAEDSSASLTPSEAAPAAETPTQPAPATASPPAASVPGTTEIAGTSDSAAPVPARVADRSPESGAGQASRPSAEATPAPEGAQPSFVGTSGEPLDQQASRLRAEIADPKTGPARRKAAKMLLASVEAQQPAPAGKSRLDAVTAALNDHPEKALAMLSPEEVRAVGVAMGRKFSPKASHTAIAERLSEGPRRETIKAMGPALVKVLAEKAAPAAAKPKAAKRTTAQPAAPAQAEPAKSEAFTQADYDRVRAKPANERTQAELDAANAFTRARDEKARASDAEAAAARKAARDDTDGFADSLAPMQRQKIINALNVTVSRNGKLQSRKQVVRDAVAAGATVGQQEGQRALIAPDGAYTLEKNLSKTAIDYAQHLLAQKDSKPTAGDKAEPQRGVGQPTKLRNFSWDAVKLADAYTHDELNALRAEVEAEHANPKDAQGHPMEGGQSSIYLYDREGRRKLDKLAWAVTYKLQESKAKKATIAAQIAKDNPPPNPPAYVVPAASTRPAPNPTPTPVTTKVEPIKMTPEEWRAEHRDYKGVIDGQRSVMRGGRLVPVEIVKAPGQPTKGKGKAKKSAKAIAPSAETQEALLRVQEDRRTDDRTDFDVKKVVGSITKAWVNAPQVKVVDSPFELPAAIKREAYRYGKSMRDVRGVYRTDENTVYIVGRNATSRQDVEETLFHEVYGHHGLRLIFGEQTQRQLQRLLNAVGGVGGLKRYARAHDIDLSAYDAILTRPDLSSAEQGRVLFDELFAHMAERIDRLPNNLAQKVKEFIGAVRAWLRQHGFETLAGKLSDGEVAHLLRQSRKAVEGDTDALAPDMADAPLFSFAGDTKGQPFRNWFKQSAVANANGTAKIVYHGTAEDFWTFSQQHLSASTGHSTSPLGFFFTENKAKAQHYAENASQGVPADERVIDAYLSIQKPKVMSAAEFQSIEDYDQAKALKAKLQREGYDGIHFGDVWVAFAPTQVKSASLNNGNFDSKDSDIRFSFAGDRSALRDQFGDNADMDERLAGTKVVDADGKPATVFHGTSGRPYGGPITAFSKQSRSGLGGAIGHWFASTRQAAQVFARERYAGVKPQVMAAQLAIKNPKEYDGHQAFVAAANARNGATVEQRLKSLRASLVRAGHDGIVVRNSDTDNGGVRDDWVAFEPQQIVMLDHDSKESAPDTGIRFSMRAPADAVGDIEAVMNAGADRSTLQVAKDKLADLTPAKVKDALRGTWLGALATNHLTELGSDYFTNIKHYSDFLGEMNADRNQLQQEGEEMAEPWRQWAAKHPEAQKELAGVMHDSTIDGVDPSEAYKPLQFRYGGKVWEVNKKNIRDALAAIRQQMRERSGDSKKNMLDEAKALRAMLNAEGRRVKQYPALVQRYAALPEEAKAYYAQVRDAYLARSKMVEDGLVQRIEDTDAPENQKRKLITTIRAQFEAHRLQGVYFPLQRHGQYFVAAEKGDTHTFLMTESLSDLERKVRSLKDRGWTIKAQGLKSQGKASEAPSGTFVADVIVQLQKAGVSDAVQDDIYQMYLEALPELSMRKHAIHRKAVPGFDPDAIRAFAFNMHHGAHQIARLRYAHKLSDTISVLKQQQDAARREEGADTRKIAAGDAILGELDKRHQWIMNPQDSKAANLASSFGFIYYLGLTPAASLVNLTQTALLTFPHLAAKYGPVKAMNRLLAAFGESASTLGHAQKKLTGDELRAHEELQRMGALDKTQAHNLAGIAEGGLSGYNPKWAKAMQVIGWGFHKTEVINRETTGLATYRLAREAGETHEQAVKSAARAITDTHFDYSSQNRSRFMQSGTAKVLLMFRQYSLNMTWALGRMVWQATKGADPEVRKIARRNLAGVLGMSALFSGTLGLPLMSVTFGVLNALAASFGDDDEPWDAETEFRAFLSDMLGEGVGEVLANGPVNALTGADIASRVSLSQLWFRDADRELDGRGAYYNLLEQAAGPMGGVLKNALVGKQMMDEGHFQRGVETMLPKALKDTLKAQRYAAEGVNNLRGDPLVEDLPLKDTLLQLVGFTPDKVASQYDKNRALKNYEQAILDRRQRLTDAFAMAIRTGDDDGRAEVIEKIKAFNARYPEIPITMKGLRRSIAQRARYSQDAEHGIMLNRKLAARVHAEVEG